MRASRAAAWGVVVAACAIAALVPACERSEGPTVRPPAAVQVDLPVRYRLAATLQSGVEGLTSVAVDAGGGVYVGGADGVRVLDGSGNELRRFGAGKAVQCLAIAPNGNVYVGLATQVEQYDPEGRLVTSWGEAGTGPGQLAAVTEIALAGPDVFVADAGNRVIHRFDATGDFVLDIGRRDPEAGVPGLLCPSAHLDCIVDSEGALYVGNPGRLRVERYDGNGVLMSWWGEPGMGPDQFCGCCNPTDMALTPEGNIVTAEKGIPRVKVLDTSGKLLAYIGRDNFSLHAVGMDVAVDAAGRIYVADPGDGNVRVFERIP